MLQRTQVMLDQQLKDDLHFLSKKTGKSTSALVRDLLKKPVRREKKQVNKKSSVNQIQVMLEMAESAKKIDRKYGSLGPTDLALNHDHYLYGAPKKKQP